VEREGALGSSGIDIERPAPKFGEKPEIDVAGGLFGARFIGFVSVPVETPAGVGATFVGRETDERFRALVLPSCTKGGNSGKFWGRPWDPVLRPGYCKVLGIDTPGGARMRDGCCSCGCGIWCCCNWGCCNCAGCM